MKPACERPVGKNRLRFQRELRGWFAREGKDYPWRRTRDPYAVVVSEVMLQQTRIATVLERGYYTRFLQAFPDVHALAGASDEELLKVWEGLGYYRRVRMLRSMAQAVVERHGGVFPRELGELLELPGVGRYTAGALRAFAFELPAVLVDGNVMRVVARLFDLRGDPADGGFVKRIWEQAAWLADDGHPREYHSALMELGQTYCRVGSPDCGSCPVASFCITRQPDLVPGKKSRKPAEQVTEHAVWYRDRRGRVLLHRESGSRRTGLWKLPLRERDEVKGLRVLSETMYSITRYRVCLRVVDGGVVKKGEVEREGDVWCDAPDLEALAMAAPFRRVVEKLLPEF